MLKNIVREVETFEFISDIYYSVMFSLNVIKSCAHYHSPRTMYNLDTNFVHPFLNLSNNIASVMKTLIHINVAMNP